MTFVASGEPLGVAHPAERPGRGPRGHAERVSHVVSLIWEPVRLSTWSADRKGEHRRPLRNVRVRDPSLHLRTGRVASDGIIPKCPSSGHPEGEPERIVKARLKGLLHRAGWEITRYPAPDTLGWNLRAAIRNRQVRLVIDVGAHVGEFASLVRQAVGYDGQLVSFEPARESFERLSAEMAGDTRWTGHRLALGSADASLKLNAYENTVFNSFRDVNEFGREILPGEELTTTGTESVEVRRLDEVVESEGPILLKSDTQGYDLEVLAGATALMDRIEVIVLELPVRNIYEGAPTMLEMLTQLDDLGYELLTLAPVTRDPAYFRVIEFDGIFVHAADAGRP